MLPAAFHSNEPAPPTHYVVWTQADSTGVDTRYASQHMVKEQAQMVADIKQTEGAKNIRMLQVIFNGTQ